MQTTLRWVWILVGVVTASTSLAARGESLASHRDGRGAPMARRDDREPGPPPRVVCAVGWQYREYLREEQRSQPGVPNAAAALGAPNAAGLSPRAVKVGSEMRRDCRT